MAKYIMLLNWTEQGIKNVKDSPKRLDAGKALAKKLGADILKFYMTIGAYDLVLVLESPSDEVTARFALSLASAGNVRTTTMKAFSEESYRNIIGSLG
ncbi:MAG TPA: GYD domain-containing protein [Dongiaceae bacterium]|nr:GYD domain-containing protein [Dongiaceae bacterium]